MFLSFVRRLGLLLLACFALAPGASADIPDPRVLARRRNDAYVLRHRDLICARARAYGVNPVHVARLIDLDLNRYDLADGLQDAGARQGWFFRLYGYRADDAASVAAADRHYLEQRRADAERLARRQVNPLRNQRTHWMFTSFGPGQVQLYVARGLLPRVRAAGFRAPAEWSALARTLATMRGSIEFIAAYVSEMLDEYRERAGLDLGDHYIMVQELYLAGSVAARAEIRREAERRGRPLPIPFERPSDGGRWERAFEGCAWR